MPTQRLLVRVPFTDDNNDSRIFCSQGGQLRPRCWPGTAGRPRRGSESTILLEGKNFSVHDTHVIAGGKPAKSVLVSRNVMQVTIAKDASPPRAVDGWPLARHQRRHTQRGLEPSADRHAPPLRRPQKTGGNQGRSQGRLNSGADAKPRGRETQSASHEKSRGEGPARREMSRGEGSRPPVRVPFPSDGPMPDQRVPTPCLCSRICRLRR